MARPRVRTDEVRDRLLTAALELLEQEGPPALRARRVADEAETSTGALYEFFGDKSGLIRALFFEGFEQLDEREAVLETTADPQGDLVELLALGRAFAMERPLLYDLMFGRPFAEFDPSEAESEVMVRLYRRTVRAVRRWLEHNGSKRSAKDAAEILVATHRGLVAAELAGMLGSTPARRHARYRDGVATVLAGLLTTSPENTR